MGLNLCLSDDTALFSVGFPTWALPGFDFLGELALENQFLVLIPGESIFLTPSSGDFNGPLAQMGAPKAELGVQNTWIQAQVPPCLGGGPGHPPLGSCEDLIRSCVGEPMANASSCGHNHKASVAYWPKAESQWSWNGLEVEFLFPSLYSTRA